jgi:hypothetical protein
VFIIQIAGDLTLAAGVNIRLVSGALSQNIFWQVAGFVVMGANCRFRGTVIATSYITTGQGVDLVGRLLAQAACTLGASPMITLPGQASASTSEATEAAKKQEALANAAMTAANEATANVLSATLATERAAQSARDAAAELTDATVQWQVDTDTLQDALALDLLLSQQLEEIRVAAATTLEATRQSETEVLQASVLRETAAVAAYEATAIIATAEIDRVNALLVASELLLERARVTKTTQDCNADLLAERDSTGSIQALSVALVACLDASVAFFVSIHSIFVASFDRSKRRVHRRHETGAVCRVGL